MAAAVAVTVPHLSFATDLLFNLEEVRTGCSNGLATQSAVVTLLKNRITLERHYANELNRMAQQSALEELEHGTMGEALGKLKAQYLNTSVQHRSLANNLEEDVLRPIEALYTYNNQKAQNLTKLTNNIKKQAKVHEDAYRRDYQAFDKHFREAMTQFAAAMDAGFSSTDIEQQYHSQLAQLEFAVDDAEGMQMMMVLGGNGSSTEGRPRQKSSAAIQTLNNSSQKLVNWLLSSDQQKKENVYTKAVQLVEATEISRRKCLLSWEHVEQGRLDMYRALQSVLTEYQQMAEHRISNLATNLRKHVVFESSALANEQYDWQMIASKIENVDFEGDIREFIMENYSHDLEAMTVNDLCHVAATSSLVFSPNSKPCRPLKRSPLCIADLALRKIPYDHEGNREPVGQVLVTRVTAYSPRGRSAIAPVVSGVASAEVPQHLRVQIPTTTRERESMADSRVCLAQDVARAIVRAYELRSVQKNSLQSPLDDHRDAGNNVVTDPLSPTADANKSTSPSPCARPEPAQSNDMDQEDTSLHPIKQPYAPDAPDTNAVQPQAKSATTVDAQQ